MSEENTADQTIDISRLGDARIVEHWTHTPGPRQRLGVTAEAEGSEDEEAADADAVESGEASDEDADAETEEQAVSTERSPA